MFERPPSPEFALVAVPKPLKLTADPEIPVPQPAPVPCSVSATDPTEDVAVVPELSSKEKLAIKSAEATLEKPVRIAKARMQPRQTNETSCISIELNLSLLQA